MTLICLRFIAWYRFSKELLTKPILQLIYKQIDQKTWIKYLKFPEKNPKIKYLKNLIEDFLNKRKNSFFHLNCKTGIVDIFYLIYLISSGNKIPPHLKKITEYFFVAWNKIKLASFLQIILIYPLIQELNSWFPRVCTVILTCFICCQVLKISIPL